MKQVLLFISLLFFTYATQGQPYIQWQKAYGGNGVDELMDIKRTPDGGYIAIGGTSSHDWTFTGRIGNDLADYCILKFDSSHVIQWVRTYGGSAGDKATSVLILADNTGYIVYGNTGSIDGDVTNNHGYADVWLIKLDTAGNKIWQKTYGGTGSENGSYGNIHEMPDGSYILASSTTSVDGDVSSNHGASDVWILNIDKNGNIIWEKTYGGKSDDVACAFEPVSGGYIVAGISKSKDGDVTGNYGAADAWVFKIDSVGNILWQKNYGGSGSEEVYGITQTSDNSYVFTGFSNSNDNDVRGSHGKGDLWVVKIAEGGDKYWSKMYGGSQEEEGRDIQELSNGTYLITGYTQSYDGDVKHLHWDQLDVWLLNIADKDGKIIWEKTYGSTKHDHACKIIVDDDSNYTIGAVTTGNDDDLTGAGYVNKGDIWIFELGPGNPATNVPAHGANEIHVYPTITSGTVNIDLPQSCENAQIKIVNMFGQEVLNGQSIRMGIFAAINSYRLVLNTLPAGMYMLFIETGEEIFIHKIIYQP